MRPSTLNINIYKSNFLLRMQLFFNKTKVFICKQSLHTFTTGYGSKLASLEKYQATDLNLRRTFKINSQLSSKSFGELGVIFGPEMRTCM